MIQLLIKITATLVVRMSVDRVCGRMLVKCCALVYQHFALMMQPLNRVGFNGSISPMNL